MCFSHPASASHLDLGPAPYCYVSYGVKYIYPVSLALFAGLPTKLGQPLPAANVAMDAIESSGRWADDARYGKHR